MARFASLALLSLLAAACSSATVSDAGADGGLPADAGPHADGAPDVDSGAGVDAALDAGTATDAGPGTDAGPAVDGGPGTDAGPGVDGGDVCGFVASLDHSCTTDGSCDVVLHQTDCCGNLAAVGINHADAMRFGMLEPLCDASYPVCDCLMGPVTTDSGELATDPTTIQAACVSRGPRNVCLTYVTMRPIDAP